jgi:hypothetical protein
MVSRPNLSTETARVVQIPLTAWVQADGAPMAAGATTGDHNITIASNVVTLDSNAPSSSTVTDISHAQVGLGPEYVSGSNLTFRVACKVDTAADTNNIDLSVYEVNQTTGAVSADLCATALQATTATATAYDFTVTGADLEPGSLVTLVITSVNQDADGSNGTLSIYSTALLMDVRG